jgi:hypothetical protein
MFDKDLDTPVYGAGPIAQVLGLFDENGEPDARRAYYMLERGYLDADQIGKIWTSTRRRLLRNHLAHLAVTA